MKKIFFLILDEFADWETAFLASALNEEDITQNYSVKKLIAEFNITVKKITDLIEIYTEKELFEQNQRQWASSTPSNWPIWKWIHINTVAPFKTFRTKIRKWKKLKI